MSGRTNLRVIFGAVVMFLMLAANNSLAGNSYVARMEIITFQSMTLTDQEILRGKKEGRPVTLAGELRLPRSANPRLPAIILLHGSGGISGYVTDWEQDLNALGVATFVIDCFKGRGIISTNNDQAQLGRLSMMVDAYRALDVLAKHPKIDPNRIAIMGFSRGGQAALYSSMKRFQQIYGPTHVQYAAYIIFYPDCGTTYKSDDEVTDRPIRIYHGAADDYNLASTCRAYFERLKAKGSDVQMIEYQGAMHVFDWPGFKKPVKMVKAQTVRNCQLAEAQDGVIINAKTNKPFTYADPCVEFGPTMSYDEKASKESRKAVSEYVTSTLKP